MQTLPNCTRTFSRATPIATVKVFGTRVTVTDNVRPTLAVGGPLFAAGWRRPFDRVTYDATDNTGIRAGRLDVAGRTQRDARPCDHRLPAPCSGVSKRTIGLPAGVPDGVHTARVVAQDAAGNETFAQRQIQVDGTPPTAVLERARGRSIVISVTDAASGVAESGAGGSERNSNEPYRTLSHEGRERSAQRAAGSWPSLTGRHARHGPRCGGERRAGNPTRLSATSAKIGRRFRKVRSGRVKVPFGRVARLRGRLTLSAGQSFAGQTIVATAAVRRRGARARPAGTAVTDRRGRFSLRVPAGPSRTYRLVFNGAGGALGVARGVSVRVPASSTIRASRRRVSGRTRVRFSGRLRNLGQRIPGRGLVLILQGREGGRWSTFEDTRTNRSGRWQVSYTFSGRPGRYPIRVRIRRQSSYPFELGYSRAVIVRVG